MWKKRFTFLLIEVLISLSIIGVITTLLFHFFTHVQLFEKKIEKAKNFVYKQEHFEERLSYIFSHASSLYTKLSTDTSCPTLHFTFDNGIHPDPDFSGPIDAELTLKEKTLYLIKISEKKSDPLLKEEEILFTDIESMEVFFLFKKNNELIYVPNWEKKNKNLPIGVKILLPPYGEFAFFPLSNQLFLQKE